MNKFITKTLGYVKEKSPTILICMGVVGWIGTTIAVAKETPKAIALLEEEKKKQKVEKLSVKDTVKTTYKCYLPAVALGTVSTVCIFGGNNINLKRNAALIGLCSYTESKLKNLNDSIVETVGQKKAEEIKDKMYEKEIAKHPMDDSKEVFMTTPGSILFYESFGKRYFRSTMDDVKRAVLEFNERLLDERYLCMNDLYDLWGIDRSIMGEETGFHIEKGMLEIRFTSCIAPNGEPAIVIDSLTVDPSGDFRDKW